MGKVLKVVAGVALIGAAIFTGGLTLPLGLGVISGGAMIAIGASLALSALAPRPKVPETQLSRLNVRLDTTAPRKAVFGTTAFPLDLRYHEATGTNQEYIHYIIAHAAHEVASIDSIYFEQDLAWSSGGGVASKYSGYLTVTTRTEGAAGNEVTISSNWGSGERLTGCAYTYLRIKRTGNSKKSESPLVGGLPSRVTVIGEGALLYDPRLDSTVTGGSGAHRADDQTTWGASYSPADSYDNPALQILWWLLGWEINGKLSVGCGVPPARIDLESFIEAANICDESIALSGGGTQERYRSSGTASDSDDRLAVIDTLLVACNGTLRDTGGKLSLTVIKNDLANYVLDLDDNDLLDEFSWQQTRGLSDNYNVVRGRFVDPSTNSLYQMVDYPEVSLTSVDGIERVLSLDLAFVEDGKRAQRIAKQVLQRNQYRGTFQGVFTAKALGCDVGEVVRLSLETLGWTNKLFRVIQKEIGMDGRVPLTLLEENAAIYAWDAEESAVVAATAPTTYNPLNSPFILADGDAEDLARSKIKTFLDDSEPTPIEFLVGDPTTDSPSLSLDFAEPFVNGDVWFTPTGKVVSRWSEPDGSWTQGLADVTKIITGAQNFTLAYDSSGTLKTGETPRIESYTLESADGTAVSSGVSWSVSTVVGSWTGTVPSISGSGTGGLSINSGLATESATLLLTATYATLSYNYTVIVSKEQDPPSDTGSGGTFASDSALSSFTGTTFAAISAELNVTTGSSSTSVALTAANITLRKTSAGNSTLTDCEYKWQWWNGSTWVDVGSATASDPDPWNEEIDSFVLRRAGTITCNQTKSSLSSSTAYKFRLMARTVTGETGATINSTGTVSAQG